ncbi:MAG: radical SAM protein [Actinomycetota bacterium]|nr:radical SAM protein [Actinomycetota bacterium]
MNKLRRTLNLLNVYINYCFKRTRCNYFPIRIWVELSSRCNLQCRFCVNKNLPDSSKGDMDFNLYRKIIDEAAGRVNDVNLFHRGEPLLNKNIVPMIAYADKKGVRTRLHSNATLLNEELDREIILAGLDLISFSFDGYTKEVYEKNRAGAVFEDTLAKIVEFLEVKKKLKSKKPYTIVQVIRDKEELYSGKTPEQEKVFLENFKNLPLDRIVTRKPHNWGGLLKINGIHDEDKKARPKKYTCCTFPWYSLTIFYDGKVFLCPQDFEGKICLGDIRKEKIEEIFNGEIIRDIRKRFKSGRIEEMITCRNCDRIMRKTFMGVPLEYLGIFLEEHLRD